MSQMLAIEAVTAWCNPYQKNKLSEKIQCDLIRLDEKTVKELKALGVRINYDSDHDENSDEYKGFWIRPKSDTPVPTKDMQGNTFAPTQLIGNGSRVIAGVQVRPWVNKASGKSGVSLRWLGLRVKEYLPYDPDATAKAQADALLDEVSGGQDGFTFGEQQQTAEGDEEFDALFGDNE